MSAAFDALHHIADCWAEMQCQDLAVAIMRVHPQTYTVLGDVIGEAFEDGSLWGARITQSKKVPIGKFQIEADKEFNAPLMEFWLIDPMYTEDYDLPVWAPMKNKRKVEQCLSRPRLATMHS